jgi:hypothetical protein
MLRRKKRAQFGTSMDLKASDYPSVTLWLGCLYDMAHCIDGNSEVKYAFFKCRESKGDSLMSTGGSSSVCRN